jgi:hypothetical protein
MESAKQMGVAKKSKRASPAEDSARSTGVVKGKRSRIHNDPYAGGERSGKRAKPNATSTANVPLIVESSGITLPGPAFPLQACAIVPSPTSAPGIAPPGLSIPALSQAFTSFHFLCCGAPSPVYLVHTLFQTNYISR